MIGGPLTGRVALVTGAARGIGLAIATRLMEAGAEVIVHDRDAHAEAVARSLSAAGGSATALIHDLAKPSAPSEMLAELRAAGREPDILVLCASVEIRQTWDTLSDEAIALQSEVNVHASARLLQAFLPGMISRGLWARHRHRLGAGAEGECRLSLLRRDQGSADQHDPDAGPHPAGSRTSP